MLAAITYNIIYISTYAHVIDPRSLVLRVQNIISVAICCISGLKRTALTCMYFAMLVFVLIAHMLSISIVSLLSFPSLTIILDWPGCTHSTKLSPVVGWVGPLSQLIFSYLQVLDRGVGGGGIILWVSLLPPQIIH